MRIKVTFNTENPQEVESLINVLQNFLGTPAKKATRKTTPKKETPAEEISTEEKSTTIEEVRALLATKVADNRTDIKAKLTEFKANNVTSLKEENYKEFMEFLNSL